MRYGIPREALDKKLNKVAPCVDKSGPDDMRYGDCTRIHSWFFCDKSGFMSGKYNRYRLRKTTSRT